MKILAIDTSCDETSAAIVEGRRVLSNVIYSQVILHQKWGGVVPSIAKRAHEEKIDWVIEKVGKRHVCSVQYIDTIAVTQGPGLAIALEVGIKKAKELAHKYNKPLIAVNHLEGHLYSVFAQNRAGNPKKEIAFPYLALLVSGGHTMIILWENHLKYKVLGETIDDAAGESLDKAAKLLNLGYPGGPVIETLAQQVGQVDNYKFPRPMLKSDNLNFSFSGLKTSFYYYLKSVSDEEKAKNIRYLASSFQEAVFDTLVKKLEKAIMQTKITSVVVCGGVAVNRHLRNKIRRLATSHHGLVLFPPFKYLNGDNAAMVGIAGYYKAKKYVFVKNFAELDRIPRFQL
jgi:N6-L-threonylcarbamoyladenine synthase